MNEDESGTLVITAEEAGERLDKVLTARFVGQQSRTYFQHLIEQGLVLLNGQPVKKRIKPNIGDEVEVEFALTPEIQLTAENIPLNIIYEDDHLLIINKPAGMVVHPAPGNWSGTFVNALLYHCRYVIHEFTHDLQSNLRPGIVHRLDKDTSGLLVAAKTLQTQQRLVAMFASRQVHKEYLAICLGNPGNVDIDKPIGRHPINRKAMAVTATGKQAKTSCRTLTSDGTFSAVEVVIATGRTHQIRVHMSDLGHPILGDSVYGNSQSNKQAQKKFGVTRQLLHAWKLRLCIQ